MVRHVVSIIRIIWWGKIAQFLWMKGIWRSEYAPYTNLQYLCLPQYLGQYYSQQFYHTYLVRWRWFSIYLHGGFCHIEIELKFTPKWRTLQFFIKEEPYNNLTEPKIIGISGKKLNGETTVEYLTTSKKTTCGRFFNTFTNREGWYK